LIPYSQTGSGEGETLDAMRLGRAIETIAKATMLPVSHQPNQLRSGIP